MSDTELICNFKRCRKRIISQAWVTSCSHVFCEEDGENYLLKQSSMKCPACNCSLPHTLDVIKVDLNPSEQFKAMALSGLRPDIVMDIASRAISFWSYQVRLEYLYQENSIKTYREQLTQLQVSYEALVAKIKSEVSGLKRQIEVSKKDLAIQVKRAEDLAEKFEDKTRQCQKLQAMYDTMRRSTIPSMIESHPKRTPQLAPNTSFNIGPRTITDILSTSRTHHQYPTASKRYPQAQSDVFHFRPITPSTARRTGQANTTQEDFFDLPRDNLN